uniref:Na(+)/H(+) exchange regulatory cofactor NHE-RF1 n=1 Tax=Oncorhynchus tshawytscha TaxID=74940 RepID=A0A8C8IJE5_ONCTS
MRTGVTSQTAIVLPWAHWADWAHTTQGELRPRLCVIKKGPHGYGFNLHSEKARPGQYIRAVDEDSPAQRSGLLAKDMIVNGMTVEGKQHSEVVAAIKSGGEETSLLVVDTDTDAFFRRCKVAPTPEHLTGSLPEPVISTNYSYLEPGINGACVFCAFSLYFYFYSSLTLSFNPSLSSLVGQLSEPVIMGAIPGLNLSLQQVKERAHQKRSNKRAPPMDWSKKNELFSNL